VWSRCGLTPIPWVAKLLFFTFGASERELPEVRDHDVALRAGGPNPGGSRGPCMTRLTTHNVSFPAIA
jgi:hypothetical protein